MKSPIALSRAVSVAGITDCMGNIALAPRVCQICGAAARIDGTECLSCLLRAGVDRETDEPGAVDLDAVLAEIDVRDSDWRLGNYQILEEIGRGGMGVIYRARQRHSKRIVALKRVLSYHGDSRETLERFRREAEAAASLDHPNILPIYEVGEADGLPFFTMKYATGGTLHDAAPVLRPNARECVRLMAKVTRAVAYAHREGILHRDLKPGNILLDGRGEPMVSDFGLAKWIDADSDLTRSLAIFGTPGFIAPEQAHGNRNALTPAADVYSLGAILFDLLAGRPPFLGEHALAVIRQAAEKPAPKLRAINHSLDRDLETICAKCLEREANARYRSALDLAVDLERWLEGRTIIARPVASPVRIWRWARRNPILAAGGAAIALLAGVVYAVESHRAQLARAVHAEAVAQHSIGVLPLLDLGTGALDPQFASQLAEHLSADFARLGPARVAVVASPDAAAVVARSDGTVAATLGKRAHVRTLLSATTRQHGDKRRVSFGLLESASGERVFRRVLEVQSDRAAPAELSTAVARPIYLTLDAADLSQFNEETDPGLQNERARELILAGKALQARRALTDVDDTIKSFTKASVIEPKSALAFSLLAAAQAGRAMLVDPEYLNTAEESVRTALRINPDLPEAHRAYANILRQRGFFRRAQDELFTTFELGTSDPRAANVAANLSRMIGRPDQALAWYKIASCGEARPGENEFMIGDTLVDLAADAQAQRAYARAAELFPYLPEGWMGRCRLALLQKDFAEARRVAAENWERFRDFVFSEAMAAQVAFFSRDFIAAAEHYEALARRDPNGGGSFYGAVSYESALGRLRLAGGDAIAGRAMLETALTRETTALQSHEDAEGLYRIAAIQSSLGQIDAACSSLQSATDTGWLDYRSLDLDPRFDAIRDDPRYEHIFESMVSRVTSLRRSAPTAEAAQLTTTE